MNLQGVRSYLYQRHSLPVRIMHWTNVVTLTVLLMTGLSIFNAHPSLDWGQQSYSGKPSVLEIGSHREQGQWVGTTKLFGHTFTTTGVLGVSQGAHGVTRLAFPHWMTIPSYYSLADARLWHFFFAWVLVLNGLAYVIYSLFSRHLARDMLPSGAEIKSIPASIVDHIKFKHPVGEAARNYNVLQKLAYLAVIFILLPLIILAGWAMSPWLDSIMSGWVGLLGGRQSARTIHFVVAWLLVAFVLIHVFEVLVSGVWNHLRSMITGNYRITSRKDDDSDDPPEPPHE